MFKGLAAVLIGTIVVLTGLGVALGGVLGGTDLLNPETSHAKALQMQQEADLQAQRAAIELDIYKKDQDARLEFQNQQHSQSLAYQRDRQQMELALLQMREIMLTGVMSLVLILAGGGLTFCLVPIGRRVWSRTDSRAELHEWEALARRLDRDNKRLLQQWELCQRAIQERVVKGGNGHRKEQVVI
jgi:hypothetical protein